MTSAVAPAPPAKKKSDLGVRTVTGLALIGVALCCFVYGGNPFWLLTSATGLLIVTEWAGIIGVERWRKWVALVLLCGPLLLLQPGVDVSDLAAPLALALAMLVALVVTRAPRLVLGLGYAGVPVIALTFLQRQFDGIDVSLWTVAIVVATDVGAYFAGRSIGGPKLAPAISPNKTWAGLIGGIACAGIAGVALAHLLDVPRQLAGFAGLLAIAAQAGDLYESAMKRRAGVKDSGHILPGHGGVMDRVDGLVPVSCLVALIVASGLL